MEIWPVYVLREMHEDMGRLFALDDVVSWDVILIDGGAAGWPSDVLIDARVHIEQRPSIRAPWAPREDARPGSLLARRGPGRFRVPIQAAMVADTWNPPFRSAVTGVVRRIEVVSRDTAQDEDGVWNPTGPWVRRDIQQSPRHLAHRDNPRGVREDGLLVALELRSHELLPFLPRPST